MPLDPETTPFLLTIIVAVVTFMIAVMGCLVLGGKAQHARIAALALMALVAMPLFLLRTPMALNYYGLLCTEALFAFAFPVCFLIAACSNWMEWLSPPPQWKTRDYRQRSILSGVGLTLVSIVVAVLCLPRVTAIITDMATGPSSEVGVVEQLTLRHGRGVIGGGDFVVRGVSYLTADLSWYNTLSVGQSIRFTYSLKSRYGFPADQMILTPLGMALPALVFGSTLLVFSVGYHMLKSSSRPTDQSRSEEHNQPEQRFDSVAEYRRTKGVSPVILLSIVLLMFFGLALLILMSPFK